MIQQYFFESQDLPKEFKCQILSFMRAVWYEEFQGLIGLIELRSGIKRPEVHPVHFLLDEDDIVIGHVAVVWKRLQHAGQEYKACGLTEVFTYPAFRQQGYGLQLIQAAKQDIEQREVPIVLSFMHQYGAFTNTQVLSRWTAWLRWLVIPATLGEAAKQGLCSSCRRRASTGGNVLH